MQETLTIGFLSKPLSPARPPVVLIGEVNLTRALGLAGIPVVLAAWSDANIALASRYVWGYTKLPPIDDEPAVIARLVELGRLLHETLGRRVPLFFGSDDEIRLVAGNRDALRRHYLLMANEEEHELNLLDKERFATLMLARGLSVPRRYGWDGGGGPDLPDVRTAEGPVIVKPKLKLGWHDSPVFQEFLGGWGKARIYSSGQELVADANAQQLKDQLVIQQYIPGGDERILSFHGVADENARVLASFCGRKIRTYPMGTGESSFIELILSDPLTAFGTAVVGKLGLRGPFKIDIKQHAETDQLYVMEVNARFTLWVYLGAANGLNLTQVAYDYLVYDRPPPQTTYGTRYRWLEPYLDYQAYKELRDSGSMSFPEWLASLVATPKVHTFAWTDPGPFVKDSWRFLREMVRKRWRASA